MIIPAPGFDMVIYIWITEKVTPLDTPVSNEKIFIVQCWNG